MNSVTPAKKFPPMTRLSLPLNPSHPLTVGCVGASAALALLAPHPGSSSLKEQCDIVEIRLDSLTGPIAEQRGLWQKCELPLLFTARRPTEGGIGMLDSAARHGMLQTVMDDADFIDVEVGSANELGDLLSIAQLRGISVILSAHDFQRTPATAALRDTIARARDLGANAAKIACWLNTPDDLARLAGLLAEDHGLPLALMGMGPMAAASRLLLAQLGSVLNYGFLGETETAPGQWSAARLKAAIASVQIIAPNAHR